MAPRRPAPEPRAPRPQRRAAQEAKDKIKKQAGAKPRTKPPKNISRTKPAQALQGGGSRVGPPLPLPPPSFSSFSSLSTPPSSSAPSSASPPPPPPPPPPPTPRSNGQPPALKPPGLNVTANHSTQTGPLRQGDVVPTARATEGEQVEESDEELYVTFPVAFGAIRNPQDDAERAAQIARTLRDEYSKMSPPDTRDEFCRRLRIIKAIWDEIVSKVDQRQGTREEEHTVDERNMKNMKVHLQDLATFCEQNGLMDEYAFPKSIPFLARQCAKVELAESLAKHRVNKAPDDEGWQQGKGMYHKWAADVVNRELGASNISGQWRLASRIFGELSTRITLWVVLDDEGRIKDRIVRKDIALDPTDWASAQNFIGGLRDPDRMPFEYALQERVSNADRARFVVKNRALYKLQPELLSYTLYLEYCPFGNLRQFCLDQRQARGLPLPESFIILVFQALIESGLIMEQGGLDGPQQHWAEVVHRDIKPDNVFLDVPADDHFNAYPRPKLADFGLAFETDAEDPLNPMLWNNSAGTKGYLAPDQINFRNRLTKEPMDNFKMLAKCNVWGVGTTVFEAITGDDLYKSQPTYVPGGKWTHDWEDRQSLEEFYSADLLDNVEQCLAFDPDQRPSFRALKEWIEGHIEKLARLRDARDGRPHEQDKLTYTETRPECGLNMRYPLS